MPTDKDNTPRKIGEEKNGFVKKPKGIPRTFHLSAELQIPFMKVCRQEYTDFTKRINKLIHEDIKNHNIEIQ